MKHTKEKNKMELVNQARDLKMFGGNIFFGETNPIGTNPGKLDKLLQKNDHEKRGNKLFVMIIIT